MEILSLFFLLFLNFYDTNSCFLSSSLNSSNCKACTYPSYYDFPLTDPNSEFPSTSCKSLSISKYTIKIYINNTIGNCSDCTGTITSPYNNIITALIKTWKIANTYYMNDLYFYLIGTSHYINKNDWGSQDYITIFRRTYANITWMPLYCSDYNISGCFDNNLPIKPVVYLKTDQFYIFICNNLTINNVIFDGSDIQLANFTTINTLYTKICEFSDLNSTYTPNFSNPKINCSLRNKIVNTSKDSYSLFNLEVILDDYTHSEYRTIKPTIYILNCEFLYIHSFNSVNKGYKSLIAGIIWSHQVFIYWTKFNYFYLVGGIYFSRIFDNFYMPTFKNNYELEKFVYLYDFTNQNMLFFVNCSVKNFNYFELIEKIYPIELIALFLIQKNPIVLSVINNTFIKNCFTGEFQNNAALFKFFNTYNY